MKIFGDIYRLKAEVEVLNTFSAHADYEDIVEYTDRLDKGRLKRIFLVHGEPDAQAHLKGLLEGRGHKVTTVRYNETYSLDA